MSILAFNFLYGDETIVRKYPSKRHALQQRNDWFIPENADALAIQTILAPDDKLVELLNRINPDQPVESIEDRSSAATTIFNYFNSTLSEEEGPNMENDPMSNATTEAKKAKAKNVAKGGKKAPAKAPAKKPTKKEAAAPRGRTSNLAGHKLVANVALDADKSPVNPRRVGTHGHKSMAIIIKAGKAGITTEDFIKAGGRMNDLHWDVDRERVVATPPKG